MKSLIKYAVACVAVAAALAPIYWLVTISLKSEIDQFASPPLWFAFTPTFRHYAGIFAHDAFGKYFLNSVIVSTCSTIVAILLGLPAAYALARLRWPAGWARGISFWILSNRMLPPIVTIIPLFLMLRQVRLLNSLAGLVLVDVGLNLPFVIWMMRGFVEELPREIDEAALLDGESRFGVLVRFILPLVRPGLAATAVFCLIVSWNEFLMALILSQTESAMTLPVGIASHVTQYEIQWGSMSAAGVVAMLPVLIFAAAAQRYFVRGLSLGALKG